MPGAPFGWLSNKSQNVLWIFFLSGSFKSSCQAIISTSWSWKNSAMIICGSSSRGDSLPSCSPFEYRVSIRYFLFHSTHIIHVCEYPIYFIQFEYAILVTQKIKKKLLLKFYVDPFGISEIQVFEFSTHFLLINH